MSCTRTLHGGVRPLVPVSCQYVSFLFFNSVLRPFQDYFSSYETGQSVDGQKRENPEENHLGPGTHASRT